MVANQYIKIFLGAPPRTKDGRIRHRLRKRKKMLYVDGRPAKYPFSVTKGKKQTYFGFS